MTRSLKISRSLIHPATSDLAYSEQWAWDRIGVKQAWQWIENRQAIAEQPVIVAIVDWGFQHDHPAFRSGLVEPGTDVISAGNGDIGDDDGHGTLLAGTIAGVVTNIPAGGEAISSVRLLPVKFIDTRNPPTSGNAAKAIIRAVDDGAKIINASWDVGLNSGELREAIEHARNQGVLVVVAAGNGGGNNTDYPTFPASFGLSNMIAVMASDEQDQKPGFSNYGENVDISAPGVNIISTSPYIRRLQAAEFPFATSAYRNYSGTSPAAAHVSGAAAVLLSIKPHWTPQDIRACLIASADHMPTLEAFCPEGRRLNMHRAVENALQVPNGMGKGAPSSPRGIVRTRLREL